MYLCSDWLGSAQHSPTNIRGQSAVIQFSTVDSRTSVNRVEHLSVMNTFHLRSSMISFFSHVFICVVPLWTMNN